MSTLFPNFLEEVPFMLHSSFHPGPEDGAHFRAEPDACFVPLILACGEEEALKGGKEASEN
jgi:hypothetical protein